MHKNTHRIDAHIPEELKYELREQPGGITQMVVDAVAQYNKTLPLAGHFERQDVKERLIKEAEEEAAKVFLEGIMDIVQRGNS